MTNYLIIGSGAAGISAIEAIRSQDPSGEITLACEEKDGYYSRPGLAYLLSGEIPEQQLYPFHEQDFQKLRVHRLHAEAIKIDPEHRHAYFNNGMRLGYTQLLIATGASAVMSKVPGLELQGVIKLDTLDESRRILKLARKSRHAVVVGGGITALEIVEGLRARGVRVEYFLRGDRYWSNVLDETESRIVEHRLQEEGTKIHFQTELAEILGKNGKVIGVRTVDGRTIRCDIVGIAIGVVPRKGLGEAAGLKVNKGILVDEHLRSSIPNIFAAGDVAQVYDPTIGKALVDSLWDPARAQGYTAGLNMTGQNQVYIKGVPFNVTRLAGLTTTIIGSVGGHEEDPDVVGIVRGDSEAWREAPDALAVQSNFEINRLRLLVGENHLVGAIVMGDQKLSRAIHQMVVHKVDMTPVRQELIHPHGSIEDVLVDYWAQVAPFIGRHNAIQQS
jgi:NAD(P)H-nitrite reductase large subunit